MDGQRFDNLSRVLASGVSRREMLRGIAVGAGGALLATVGFVPVVSDALAASKLKLSRSPKVTFEGPNAVVNLQVNQSAKCVIEYGPTTELSYQAASDGSSKTHAIVLRNLVPKTRYYFRVQLRTESANETSKVYNFRTPSCPRKTVLCGGACISACAAQMSFDESTCSCVCKPGFENCDGDPSTGCETALNSVENCLACGNSCDDGNACTEHTCDSNSGCITTNLTDGTSCGSGGSCENGTCVSCLPGDTCEVDKDCCDDEVCCGGTCVAKAILLSDVSNCGACGNACSSLPCQSAICIEGACQAEPLPERDPCDDGNPCTVDDHCMAGSCMGNPVEDGTPCGDGSICSEGVCVTCTQGKTCAADSECCPGEGCCAGTCVSVASFQDDPVNCGACGAVCESEDSCQQVVCVEGACGTQPVSNGAVCGDDNACLTNAACNEGTCVGRSVDDGTLCGTAGTCQAGECIEPQPVSAVAVGSVFEDDFELGNFSKWSSTSSIQVQSSIVAAGTKAARATGSGKVAYARKALGTTYKDLSFRTRFQLISLGNNSVSLIHGYKSSTSSLISVLVTSNGKLATKNSVTAATTTSATDIAKGVWHELQMRVKIAGASSTIEIWLNGAKVADLSKTLNLGTTGVSQIRLGEITTNRTYDVAFDDVAVCAGDLCPAVGSVVTPPQTDGTSTAPGAASGVLIATYTHNSSKGAGVNWSKVVYRPRQFKNGLVVGDPTRGDLTVDDAGVYVGWDVFSTFNASVHRIETKNDWTVLEINRAAVLAIVWRGGSTIPAWLSNWTKSSDVIVAGRALPTFRKNFAAGAVILGAVYDPGVDPNGVTRDTYWVLFAESDGLPSPAPSVSAGKVVPTPNATCPTWVHDQYTSIGPDGSSYPTWHALIDPIYWCYHRHDHGTNPMNFSSNKTPAFGYTAAKHGMSEPHAGFKNYIFDSVDGTRWMVTHHFGTAGLARACGRFHTVDMAVRDIVTGELIVDLHFMGDFGKSVINRTQEALTPPTCPDQASLAAGSSGIRMIPAQSADSVGYEPWRVDLKKTIFGFVGDFTVNNPDPIVICNNATCDQPVTTGNSGTKRFFTPNRSATGSIFGLVAKSSASGNFYTDPSGTKVLGLNDPGATKQYIKPGINIVFNFNGNTGHCYDVNAWGKKYVCGVADANSTDREGSVQAPN